MSHRWTRRQFLKTSTALTAGYYLRPIAPLTGPRAPVRFGVIADVHHGLAPDASARLESFLAAVRSRDDLDFAIQLGDFCHPVAEAREFCDAFTALPLPTHHVLGNHDMDKGSKSDVLRFWGMPDRWYSFDVGDVHCVVLDLNHLRDGDDRLDYDHANFYVAAERRAWAHPDQLDWLAADLKATRRPTLVFSHQPLGLHSSRELPPQQREVLDCIVRARDEGTPVLACICGHLHVDRHRSDRGIHSVCINSASYHWAEGMHPYQEPLFAFLSVEADGTLEIEGRMSAFSGKHPRDLGLRQGVEGVEARISDRKLDPEPQRDPLPRSESDRRT